MAHVLKAFVGESSTSTGTEAFTLDAALADHRRFSAVCSTGDTVEYYIRHATDGTWEAGVGTYSSANTLTRTTVVESSTGSAISFAAGDKEVILAPLASSLGVGPDNTVSLTNKTIVGGVHTGAISQNGSVQGNVTAMGALAIDCSQGNYFTKSISGGSTFTFSNVPSGCVYSCTFELHVTSGTCTWPSAVKWPDDIAPTLSSSKTHLIVFVTDDGGTRWRGAVNANYVQ